MAAVHSLGDPTRPARASGRRSTVPTAPKLRDSCHACAASKVKCSKEKPTCARCAKRAQACEYGIIKRAGRKHDTRPSGLTTTNLPHSLPGASSSTLPGTNLSTPPNLIQPSPRLHTSGYSDLFQYLLPPADPASASTLTPFSTDFDDFLASPTSFPFSKSSDPDILAQPHIDFSGINNGLEDSNGAANFLTPEDTFSVIDDTVSDFPSLSKTRSSPNSRASTTSDSQSLHDFRSESPCSCLVRALGLLKQLFPNASTACTRSGGQGYEDTIGHLPTIQSVVAENGQTIEAISKMLQCPCLQDGYLLAIISIIVFKVVDWYAAAARETPVTDDGQRPSKPYPDRQRDTLCTSEQVLQIPTVVGSDYVDGEDQSRMAAQLILGELHRVQRLVNVLSQRLKSHGTRHEAVSTTNNAAGGQDTPLSGESTRDLSATMMDQFEADLRKRLRVLSLEIVNTLRRG